MQQANERQRQMRREARYYGQLIGYAGGILAVLQVSAGGSAAYENQPTQIALQHALVNLSHRGGADPLPAVDQLGPMWTLVGAMSLLIFCATLWLCGAAGRFAAIATGDRRAGRLAGSRAALVTSGIWILVSLLAAGVFHVDGGFSWLFATIAVLIFSSAAHVPNVLLSAPSSEFVVAHLTILAITHVVALLITWGLGAAAGSIGAHSAPRHTFAAPGMLPPYAAPIYLPPMAPAYPPVAPMYQPPVPVYQPPVPAYPQYPPNPNPQAAQDPQSSRYPLYPFYLQQIPQYPPVASPPQEEQSPADSVPAPSTPPAE